MAETDVTADVTLVEKRDDLTPVEFYQIIEKANHRLEKYDLQQAYAAPYKISRYAPGAMSLLQNFGPRNRGTSERGI
jgi:hypothetical protein